MSAEGMSLSQDQDEMCHSHTGFSERDIIKERILQEFSEDEIKDAVRGFEMAKLDPNLDAKIFQRQMNDSLDFYVFKSARHFGGGIGFVVELDGDRKAQIVYMPMGNDLEMTHREVHSQELGIGGTTLLKRAEEYFAMLKAQGVLQPELKNFLINAGQVGVIEWALNNGYEFENEADAILFRRITAQDGNGEYMVMSLTEGRLFSNYIFKREAFEADKDRIMASPAIAKQASVRFKLRKEIPETNF